MIIKSIEKVLNLHEREGVIIKKDGSFELYHCDYSRDDRKIGEPYLFKAGCVSEQIKTVGIYTCTGIFWENSEDIVLAHLFEAKDFKHIMPILWNLSKTNSGKTPSSIQIIESYNKQEFTNKLLSELKIQTIPVNTFLGQSYPSLGSIYIDLIKNTVEINPGINQQTIPLEFRLSKPMPYALSIL